jgi:hypothetical protein
MNVNYPRLNNMEKLDIILTVMIAGFGLMMSLMLIIWNNFNKKMDKLEERVTKIEHEMIEIKTILRFKESCRLQDERNLSKAE